MSALNLEQRHEVAGGHLSWRDCAHAGWIRRELIATELGRDRLRSWAAAAPVANPGELRFSPCGDVNEALVVSVLERLPPPVLHHVVEHCALLALGRDVAGCACNAMELEGRILIVVTQGSRTDVDTSTTVAHEAAHAWLHQSLVPWQVGGVGDRQARLAAAANFADQFGMQKQWAQHRAAIEERKHRASDLCERQACALVRAWGFRGAGAYHHRRKRQ